MAEFMRSMYPAFSRRATQVCILSSALEKIAYGAADAPAIARTALEEANPFGWKERAAQYESWDQQSKLACQPITPDEHPAEDVNRG